MIVFASGALSEAFEVGRGLAPRFEASAGVASTLSVLLAAVFVVAAVAKLRAPAATSREFRALGLPGPKLLARLAPATELGVAALLVIIPPLGGVTASVLLVGLTGVLWQSLRAGRTVSCGCFGSLGRSPVTVATLARNLGFLAMAVPATTLGAIVRPDLPSILVSVTLVLLGGLAVQAVSLRTTLGRIWSVDLAGEAGRADPPGITDPTNSNLKGVTT